MRVERYVAFCDGARWNFRIAYMTAGRYHLPWRFPMAAKDVVFSQSARRRITHGVDVLANTVKVTLGPRGRTVLLERSWGAPTATKDGVTVAKEIELEDRLANLGAQMGKGVAAKTPEA